MWKVDGDKIVVDAAASSGLLDIVARETGVTFTKGQGLPGRAWAAGGTVEFAPNVQALDPSKYGRLDLAKQLGIKGSAAAFKDGVVIEVGCSSELSAPPAI